MNSDLITGINDSQKLERKMHLKGKVKKTSKAGAIIDIGVEKPALLHVSQITSEKGQSILKVEDALKENQEIDVYIRNIRDDRIEVSMKKPLALEWREIEKDQVLKGKVVQIENFGVFVDIGAEKPGLVHISELTHSYVRNASDVVSIGDDIEVKVIDFNRRRKQIKLSMKALEPGLDEIDGVIVTPAKVSRRDRKERKSNKPVEKKSEDIQSDPEPTVMEIALREAMDKAGIANGNKSSKSRKTKNFSNEQEEILSRTLDHRN